MDKGTEDLHRQEVQEQKDASQKAESVLAQCVKNGSFYDSADSATFVLPLKQ